MARLDPRYMTMVHDLDQTDDGRLFIVMEYLEGRTLGRFLRLEGPLPVRRVSPSPSSSPRDFTSLTRPGSSTAMWRHGRSWCWATTV